ncbi:AAA family ATPase [Butyrivibrio sp. AE3006]|uniref:AAA family ATPase n=1 Tax=Butyrivibrio sp. AE3006 TaxID=1280673 RepID=UPI000420D410|nr:AAA family ATPase [Butyrivibrio sp. AE3006]
MGIYLDSADSYELYKRIRFSKWFIDKTGIITELVDRLGTTETYICVTRPRRFGKTVAANMIAAYFSKSAESRELFDGCEVSKGTKYQDHINSYHVISIDFSKIDDLCKNYDEYISAIKKRLANDLREVFRDIDFREDSTVFDDLKKVFDSKGIQFVFVLDEWDAVFHMSFISEADRARYLLFLKNLLKDQAYVAMAYMTGILPIAKYSSGSELNMFLEYTMAKEERFGKYFGFLQDEVDALFSIYSRDELNPRITIEDLGDWYDGYHTFLGERVYNPRSVIAALTNNNLGNYWTNAGPYDEIFYYIRNNIDGVKDDLALMISGEKVRCEAKEYAATSMNLKTRDEILSAMVVYGFLSYSDGFVMIPNKELMGQFADMISREASLGYVYRLARESEKVLEATLLGREDEIASILECFHDSEAPIIRYNNESDLSVIVNLAYLAARDRYDVHREDKSGKGFVDFIFYPKRDGEPGIILELKVDDTAESAINQIKEKKYIQRFTGKVAEIIETKRVVFVGISYDKMNKKHTCKIEDVIVGNQ